MKRKIVKQGAATLMVSLPSAWLRENKLGKGDEIDLEVFDDNLFVSATNIDIKREIEITLHDLAETSIRTLITNTYITLIQSLIHEYTNSIQRRICNVQAKCSEIL